MKRVIRGEEREVVGATKDGAPIEGPPRLRDRLYAVELLAEHGHGKPPQKLEVESQPEQEPVEVVKQRVLERLPRLLAALSVEERQLLEWLQRGKVREVLVSGRKVDPDPSANAAGDR